MPAPILPSDFSGYVPSYAGPQCEVLRKMLLTFPNSFYLNWAYMFNEDGSFTDLFTQELCALGQQCPGFKANQVSGSGPTGGGAIGGAGGSYDTAGHWQLTSTTDPGVPAGEIGLLYNMGTSIVSIPVNSGRGGVVFVTVPAQALIGDTFTASSATEPLQGLVFSYTFTAVA